MGEEKKIHIAVVEESILLSFEDIQLQCHCCKTAERNREDHNLFQIMVLLNCENADNKFDCN